VNYLIALATLIPIILLGDLTFQLAGKKIQSSMPLGQRFALDWALGTGGLTLIVFYSSLINANSGYLASIAITSLLGLIHLLRVLRSSNATRGITGKVLKKYGAILLIFLFLLAILWYVAGAAGLGFDGTAHWGIKAKASFLEGGWVLIPPGLNRFPHQNYPLLVPTQQGWLYTFENAVDPNAVKIIFVSFYLALGTLFYHAVRYRYTPVIALLYSLLVMTTPLLAISSLPAYADIPLMVFVLGSVVFISKWLQTGEKSQMVLGAVLAAYALLVKMEGLVYWLFSFIFIMVYAAWFYRNNKAARILKQALLFPLITIAIAGSWFLYTWQSNLGVNNFNSPTISSLVERIDRLPVIFNYLTRLLFFGMGYWGLLWLIFVVVSIWKWRSLARVDVLYIWLSVTAPIFALSISFVFSQWPSYITHFETALPRLVMQTVPIAWLFIASQISEINEWFQSIKSSS